MNRQDKLETIMAYLDGELTEPDVSALEEQLARDSDRESDVANYREIDMTVRAAFNGMLHEPLPERLRTEVRQQFRSRRESRRRGFTRIMLPIAASVAVVAVSLAGGYLASGFRIDQELATIQKAQARQDVLMEQAVNRALEYSKSGVEVWWSDPETGNAGWVTPVRTYRSVGGHWCREYRAGLGSASSQEQSRATACRVGDGEWMTVEQYFYDG